MGDNIIISSSQQQVGHSATNLSLVKLGTFAQTILGVVITSVVVAATVATVILIGTGVGYQPPIAKPDAISAYKLDKVTIFPLSNDKDPKGARLTITKVSQPSHGTVTINSDSQSVVYQSIGDYTGMDQFEYTVSNDKLSSKSFVDVNVLNHVPECADFTFQVSRNSLDNAYNLFDIVQEGRSIIDLDQLDTLRIAHVDNSTLNDHSLVTFSNRTLFYTPAHQFSQTEAVMYFVSDGTDQCNGTLTFNIRNDAPVAVPDTFRVRKNLVHTLDILDNDYDINGDDLKIDFIGFSRGHTKIGAEHNNVTYWAIPSTEPYYDSFEYQISDFEPLNSTTFVTIEVYNTPPTVQDLTINVEKNTEDNRIVLSFDDIDQLDVLTAEISSSPTYGSARLEVVTETKQVLYAEESWFDVPVNFYTLYYTPNKKSDHDDVIEIKVSDSYDATVGHIFVNVLNKAPVAVDDTFTCSRNNAVEFNVVSNDSDPDGDDLELVIDGTLTTEKGGKVTKVSQKVLKYTAPAGFSGSQDTFKYTIRDITSVPSKSKTATGTVRVHVYNEAPIAKDDTASVYKNKVVNINVLANDVDPNGDDMTVTAVTGVDVGTSTVAISSDKKFVVFTADKTVGRVTFTYTVSDVLGLTATASVVVDIKNNAPIAEGQTVSTYWGRPIVIKPKLDGVDPDGDATTVFSSTAPSKGVVTLTNNEFLYTPNAGFVGTDSFTYTLTDGTDVSTPATITISVTNTPPKPMTQSVSTHWRNPSGVVVSVLDGATDTENDPITLKSFTTPTKGTTTRVTLANGKDAVKYDPPAQAALGVQTFTYILTDTNKDSTPGQVNVEVTNTKPVATKDDYEMHWRTGSIVLDVMANDADANSDPISIASTTLTVSPAGAGTAAVDDANKGTVLFTVPATPVLGKATFSYTVTDKAETSNSAQVTVDVTNKNKPVASALSRRIHWRTLSDATYTEFSVYSSVKDLDGDTITLTKTDPSGGKGTVSIYGTDPAVPQTLRFSGTPSWKVGNSSFTYTLKDGASSATNTISVEVYNNAPVARNIEFEFDPQYFTSGMTVDVLAQALELDPEDVPNLTVTSVVPLGAVNGTATVTSGNKQILFKPVVGKLGTDRFTYTITDGIASSSATLSVIVNYDAPKETEQFYRFHWYSIQSGTPLNLCEKITQGNGCKLKSVKSSPVPKGTVTRTSDTTVNYVPLAKTIGTDKFIVLYTDNVGVMEASITVTVTLENTAPTAPNLRLSNHWKPLQTAAYGGFELKSKGEDADSDPLRLKSAKLVKGKGTVVVSGDNVIYTLPAPENGLYYTGSDVQFSYTITDEIADYTALVDLDITNTPPALSPKTYSLHWSEYKTGKLLTVIDGTDVDTDGDSISLRAIGTVSPPSAATIALSSASGVTITGTPTVDILRSGFTFTFTATDGAAVAQGSAKVNLLNNAPVAQTLTQNVHWRAQKVEVVVASDADTVDTLTITSISSTIQPFNTRVTAKPGAILVYTPPANFVGTEVVTFVVSDGIETAQGTVTFTVFNNAPTAKDYTESVQWRAKNVFTFNAKADASDADTQDGPYLTVSTTLTGAGVTPSIYTVVNGVITITPTTAIKASGGLVAYYTVTDGLAVVQKSITLTFTNNAPTISNRSITLKRKYGQTRYVLDGANLLMTPGQTDSEGDPLTLIVTGATLVNGGPAVDFSIPYEFFKSTITIKFQYDDGLVKSPEATATVQITNDDPVCQPAAITLLKGETKSVSVVCTDGNNDPVAISYTTPVAGLTLSGNTFTYVAPKDKTLVTPVTYYGTDGANGKGSNVLTITVNSNPPVANDYTWNIFATRNVNSYTLNYLTAANPSDPEGSALSFSVVDQTCQGTATMSGATITYVRPYTYSSATCSLTVKTTNAVGQSVTKLVNVVLTTSGINAVGRSITVDHKEGDFFTLTNADIMVNDNDPLGGTLTFNGFFQKTADCTPPPASPNGFCGNTQPVQPSSGVWKFSKTSNECQTQRFRYKIYSTQDPAQTGEAVLDVRFQNCKCVKPLDIVFVIDGSGSVGSSNFNTVRDFLKKIVEPLDIGSGATQIQVGLIVFDHRVYNYQALTGSKTVFNTAVTNMPYPAGNTNIRSAVLSAEAMLKGTNSRGPTVPKMIITVFDGEPNAPCSCADCDNSQTVLLNSATCKSDRYPARDCTHCSGVSDLKCNPCADVLSESNRINKKKPGNSEGYWRVMSIGVGPFLNNKSARDLVRALSYDQNLSLAVDWNQMNQIVSTIQSQSCDLVDTSTPSDSYVEGNDVYTYCGQIVGLTYYGYNLVATDTSTPLKVIANTFNSVANRANLFQITNCGAYGTKLNYNTGGTKFRLWSLETQQYVSVSGSSLYTNGGTPGDFFAWSFESTLMNKNIPTLSTIVLRYVSNQYWWPDASGSVVLSTGYTNYFSPIPLSYADIAARTNLPAASAFPTPIQDVNKKAQV